MLQTAQRTDPVNDQTMLKLGFIFLNNVCLPSFYHVVMGLNQTEDFSGRKRPVEISPDGSYLHRVLSFAIDTSSTEFWPYPRKVCLLPEPGTISINVLRRFLGNGNYRRLTQDQIEIANMELYKFSRKELEGVLLYSELPALPGPKGSV